VESWESGLFSDCSADLRFWLACVIGIASSKEAEALVRGPLLLRFGNTYAFERRPCAPASATSSCGFWSVHGRWTCAARLHPCRSCCSCKTGPTSWTIKTGATFPT